MATELEKKKALIDAEIASDEDKRVFIELGGTIVDSKGILPVVSEESPAAPAQTGTLDFEDGVDEEAFGRGGQQYFMPSEEGFFKSKLVDSFKPEYVEKNQRWFVFETDDPKLKAQGRGVIQAELGRGAFKLKDVLDGLAIPYTVVKGIVKYSISFPVGCYADWSKDIKASGGVRISGLRTLEAGAAVERAI